MARQQNGGVHSVVEAQPRSYNNSFYDPCFPANNGNFPSLTCNQLSQKTDRRRQENVYIDENIWQINHDNYYRSTPPQVPPRTHANFPKQMSEDSRTIPSGKLTLVTSRNGYNNSKNVQTHVVPSPPSFNKPPPKIPLSNGRYSDPPEKKPELVPRPPAPALDPTLEKPSSSQEQHDQKSILICRYCGLCKCAGCKSSKELPETWLCGGRCKLSPDTVVDYGSCMCAVRGTFYHCSHCSTCVYNDSDEDYVCVDSPCLCSKPGENHCCTRWITMGLMSLCLPCLLCYLPGKACVRLCRVCYGGTHRRGCQCPPRREQLDHLL